MPENSLKLSLPVWEKLQLLIKVLVISALKVGPRFPPKEKKLGGFS